MSKTCRRRVGVGGAWGVTPILEKLRDGKPHAIEGIRSDEIAGAGVGVCAMSRRLM